MKPAPFTYHVAHDVAEAVALLTELGEDAKILAGGQSLVPMMNLRLARPSALVDITRIPGLGYLRAPATWREAGELAAAQISPADDESGDARYRRRLTATLVSRALAEASRQ